MQWCCWVPDLSVVHDVEHNGGDDAADGVGQHEDHHSLPTPQWDFGFTGQEMEQTVKVREDLLNSISIVMCNVSKTEKIIFPTSTWYPESAQQPDWTHQFQPSEWRWPDPWLFPEWPEAPPGGWTATCLPWVQSRGFNWLCILFTNMMHTNTLHVLINIVSLKQIHEQIVLSFLT